MVADALILAGQPQLLAKLALRVHLPFRQRVAMRFRMPTMDETHTRGYVEHHLRLAGRKQRLCTDEALLQPFVQSGGIPRAIGNLALTAMLNAALRAKDLVELDDVIAAAGRWHDANPTRSPNRARPCRHPAPRPPRPRHGRNLPVCPAPSRNRQALAARHRAAIANRIVVLCRRLADQIQRYERLKAWKIEEGDQLEETDLGS